MFSVSTTRAGSNGTRHRIRPVAVSSPTRSKPSQLDGHRGSKRRTTSPPRSAPAAPVNSSSPAASGVRQRTSGSAPTTSMATSAPPSRGDAIRKPRGATATTWTSRISNGSWARASDFPVTSEAAAMISQSTRSCRSPATKRRSETLCPSGPYTSRRSGSSIRTGGPTQRPGGGEPLPHQASANRATDRTPMSVRTAAVRAGRATRALERLQVLHEIGLLVRRQAERLARIVGLDDRVQRGGAAVVEVRRVLPDALERSGPVLLCRRARGVADAAVRFRLADDLAGIVQLAVGVGEGVAAVAASALARAVEHRLAAIGGGRIEGTGRRRRRRDAELVLLQRGQLRRHLIVVPIGD